MRFIIGVVGFYLAIELAGAILFIIGHVLQSHANQRDLMRRAYPALYRPQPAISLTFRRWVVIPFAILLGVPMLIGLILDLLQRLRG